MKKILLFLLVELVICFIAAMILNDAQFNYDLMTAFGLTTVMGAIVVTLIAIILFIRKDKTGKPVIITAGVLVVIGLILCNVFPLHLRLM